MGYLFYFFAGGQRGETIAAQADTLLNCKNLTFGVEFVSGKKKWAKAFNDNSES